MAFPLPRWITSMPDGERKDRAINRFMLRLAVLYAHPEGKIHNLADMLNMNPHTLKTQIQSQKVIATLQTKDGILEVLGPDFVPPDLPHIPPDRRFKNGG